MKPSYQPLSCRLENFCAFFCINVILFLIKFYGSKKVKKENNFKIHFVADAKRRKRHLITFFFSDAAESSSLVLQIILSVRERKL